MLGTLGYWTLVGRSWRLPIALVCVYLMKVCTGSLFKMRYPDGFAWTYPGFYSLTVSYGMTNDFHFTVHVALMILIYRELEAMGYNVVSKLVFAFAVTQSFVAIVLRGAYSIDIFAAFIFGFFFWHLGNYLSYYIDVCVFGLSFQERFPQFQRECGNCKHPINKWTRNSLPDLKEH